MIILCIKSQRKDSEINISLLKRKLIFMLKHVKVMIKNISKVSICTPEELTDKKSINMNKPVIYYVYNLSLKDSLIENNFLPIIDSKSNMKGTCYNKGREFWRFYMNDRLHKNLVTWGIINTVMEENG